MRRGGWLECRKSWQWMQRWAGLAAWASQSLGSGEYPWSSQAGSMLCPTAGRSPCAWISRGIWLRDCSAGAAPSLEAAVLSIIQIMGSLLKRRATRRGLVRQHFVSVFHCWAVTKSYFWTPEFYSLPLLEMNFHCCAITKSYFWKQEL